MDEERTAQERPGTTDGFHGFPRVAAAPPRAHAPPAGASLLSLAGQASHKRPPAASHQHRRPPSLPAQHPSPTQQLGIPPPNGALQDPLHRSVRTVPVVALRRTGAPASLAAADAANRLAVAVLAAEALVKRDIFTSVSSPPAEHARPR